MKILPALLYRCETWHINREDIKELKNIQITIISKNKNRGKSKSNL